MAGSWDSPGGSEVKTVLLVQEVHVLSLVGELSSLGSFFSPGRSLSRWGQVLPMCVWKCPQSFSWRSTSFLLTVKWLPLSLFPPRIAWKDSKEAQVENQTRVMRS